MWPMENQYILGAPNAAALATAFPTAFRPVTTLKSHPPSEFSRTKAGPIYVYVRAYH